MPVGATLSFTLMKILDVRAVPLPEVFAVTGFFGMIPPVIVASVRVVHPDRYRCRFAGRRHRRC
jgi:hypothetical protein